MYLRTSEGVGQVLMRYGAFAGTLGEPPLPPTIQKFLARVKKNPQNYEALLLTITYHEEPLISDQLRRVFSASFENDAKDPLEEAKAIQGAVTQALEGIYKKHLRDNGFSRLVKKEQQLSRRLSRLSRNASKNWKPKDG